MPRPYRNAITRQSGKQSDSHGRLNTGTRAPRGTGTSLQHAGAGRHAKNHATKQLEALFDTVRQWSKPKKKRKQKFASLPDKAMEGKKNPIPEKTTPEYPIKEDIHARNSIEYASPDYFSCSAHSTAALNEPVAKALGAERKNVKYLKKKISGNSRLGKE